MRYLIALTATILCFTSFVLMPKYQNDMVSQTLTLTASTKTAASGSEVCLDISTRDFQQIMSMQYSMKWKPALLAFKRVQKFGLPGMSAQSFGTNNASKGVLSFSWYDQNLRSISLPDGSSIYQVCFEVVGASDKKAYLEFTSVPTIIEISDVHGGLLELNGVTGSVKIQ